MKNQLARNFSFMSITCSRTEPDNDCDPMLRMEFLSFRLGDEKNLGVKFYKIKENYTIKKITLTINTLNSLLLFFTHKLEMFTILNNSRGKPISNLFYSFIFPQFVIKFRSSQKAAVESRANLKLTKR